MAKRFQYKVDKELELKRANADRALFRAKCRFVRWDLTIRMGRTPTEDEILGIACNNPLSIMEVKDAIRDFKRARLAKRREEERLEPINEWEHMGSPFVPQHTISEDDARFHLMLLRGDDSYAGEESSSSPQPIAETEIG